MRSLALRNLLFCILLGMPQHALASDPLQLQKSVRTLEALQDAAASGDAEALQLQGKLIAQIEADIRRTPDADLQRPQNLHSLAVVLLSGADPTIVEAHTMSLPMDENTKNLLQGALAYARADREAAAKFLNEVKTEDLPSSLTGRVSLVRSILSAGENPARAIDDLYNARQLMPGTSIEEAALRRCVAFAGKTKDIQRLRFCSGRYMRRFAQSLYWREFEGSMAMAVAQTGYGEGKSFKELMAASDRLDMARQRSLLLTLARATLTHGRLELAMALSEAAVAVCFAESPEMTRTKLYRAAALVAIGSYSEGRALLDALNQQHLSEEDLQLFTLARHVQSEIGADPKVTEKEAVQLLSTQVGATADPEIDRLLLAANTALKQAQNSLQPEKP